MYYWEFVNKKAVLEASLVGASAADAVGINAKIEELHELLKATPLEQLVEEHRNPGPALSLPERDRLGNYIGRRINDEVRPGWMQECEELAKDLEDTRKMEANYLAARKDLEARWSDMFYRRRYLRQSLDTPLPGPDRECPWDMSEGRLRIGVLVAPVEWR